MSSATSVRTDQIQGVNTAHNTAIKSTHKPAPCPNSSLNAHALKWCTSSTETTNASSKRTLPHATLNIPSNWPADVVYITQNLIAPSVPNSIAQRYILQPSPSSPAPTPAPAPAPVPVPVPDDHVEPPYKLSTPSHLPRATHRNGEPSHLYTISIQQQVSLVIWPIDERTPWDSECYHSTSRKLKCHPAAGSFGLFARDDIPHNTFIRPYLGVLHTKTDADFHSMYDLSLCHDPRMLAVKFTCSHQRHDDDDDAATERLESISLDTTKHSDAKGDQDPTALYLDSRYWGNESRFVNDYRGIAQRPNVEFRSFIQHSEDGEERFQMGLFSIKPIRKAQELVINYGKSFWIHFDQLAELDQKMRQAEQTKPNQEQIANAQPNQPAAIKLNPLQAMLQRSQMRVSRTGQNPRTPSHQPSSGPSPT
ncbi:uncharacterized protein MEPE_05018 [Melanopsichium pennsylvanicum]|uniref:SET domain-containing protein n=2 Tax=Melanopsichium pennsylvanicum TaxID=63383 RepID=A0AAJ5C7A7_9BASI|nr:set domain protein [Melanopsichium pennsylvanicum 4]SNX86309.1 uncharacterized protein MEPE_05018 [Melanopsichium pennsylvanicum]